MAGDPSDRMTQAKVADSNPKAIKNETKNPVRRVKETPPEKRVRRAAEAPLTKDKALTVTTVADSNPKAMKNETKNPVRRVKETPPKKRVRRAAEAPLIKDKAVTVTKTTLPKSDFLWSEVSDELVEPKIRDDIYKQQHEWCIDHRDFRGFQMNDAALCWVLADYMSVINVTSPTYQNVYEVALEPRELLTNKRIIFIGDSISRYVFTGMYFLLQNEEPNYKWPNDVYHSSIVKSIPSPFNINMEWYWAPKAADVRKLLERLDKSGILEKADYTIIGIGNHERRQKSIDEDFSKEMLESISNIYLPRMKNLVFQTAPRHPTMNETEAKFEEGFNGMLASKYSSHNIDVIDTFFPMQVDDQNDGIHSPTHAMYAVYTHLWRWKWMAASTQDLHIRQLHRKTENGGPTSH